MIETETPSAPQPARALWPAVGRAMARRCPACGEGRLFRGYLAQVEACDACGEALGEVRADDGPPWVTMMIVGHAMIPLVVWIASAEVARWTATGLLAAVAVALCLAVLPLAKGACIGAVWASRPRDG